MGWSPLFGRVRELNLAGLRYCDTPITTPQLGKNPVGYTSGSKDRESSWTVSCFVVELLFEKNGYHISLSVKIENDYLEPMSTIRPERIAQVF